MNLKKLEKPIGFFGKKSGHPWSSLSADRECPEKGGAQADEKHCLLLVLLGKLWTGPFKLKMEKTSCRRRDIPVCPTANRRWSSSAEQTRMLFRFHFRFLPDRTFISTYSPTAITMAAASTKYMAGSATLSPKKYRLQSTLSRMASTT